MGQERCEGPLSHQWTKTPEKGNPFYENSIK